MFWSHAKMHRLLGVSEVVMATCGRKISVKLGIKTNDRMSLEKQQEGGDGMEVRLAMGEFDSGHSKIGQAESEIRLRE
jgi:hypothetical protein